MKHEKVKKVLVVDDEVALLGPMRDFLERLGYFAACVSSGEEALEKYTSWRPDLVLMDRTMPGMDGISCTQRIMDIDPNARILLISGYGEYGSEGIDERTKAYIKGYLSKPIELSELSTVLNELFGE